MPAYSWFSPREDERVAAVRDWRRLLEIATDLECPMVNSELSGDPHDPQPPDGSFRKSMDELLPHVERYGLELTLEAHPYDFIELNDAAVDLVRRSSRRSSGSWTPRVVDERCRPGCAADCHR